MSNIKLGADANLTPAHIAKINASNKYVVSGSGNVNLPEKFQTTALNAVVRASYFARSEAPAYQQEGKFNIKLHWINPVLVEGNFNGTDFTEEEKKQFQAALNSMNTRSKGGTRGAFMTNLNREVKSATVNESWLLRFGALKNEQNQIRPFATVMEPAKTVPNEQPIPELDDVEI